MRKKTNKNIIDLIKTLQKFLDKKLPFEKMYEEVQMMKFKIRPIQGDLSRIDLNNKEFISTLWSLGKLDEFFQKEFYKLTGKNKEFFLKIFENIYEKYQIKLNKINLHIEKTSNNSGFLEIEIFKEVKNKKIN